MRVPARHRNSPHEVQLAWQMDVSNISYTSEWRFHPERRWRVDFAFIDHKFVVEVEGGIWISGRHNRGSGFLADIEKYNALGEMGFRVFRADPEMIKSGEALAMIRRLLKCES